MAVLSTLTLIDCKLRPFSWVSQKAFINIQQFIKCLKSLVMTHWGFPLMFNLA